MREWNSNIEIKYPGGCGMEAMAERLKTELLSFRVPKSVMKKTGIRNLSDVREKWLIVLCSPETPYDRDVESAIQGFIGEGLYDHILALLCRGTPEESFPESLRFEKLPDGSVVEHEPLAANIVAGSEKESRRLLRVERMRLLAPILGVGFDDLMRRSRRQIRRILFAAGSVVLAGSVLFLAYALKRGREISYQNGRLEEEYSAAEEARDTAQSQRDAARERFALSTAVNAKKAVESGDNELALLLALEFLPDIGAGTELEEVFTSALEALCAEGYVPVTTVHEYDKTRFVPEEEEPEDDGIFPEKIILQIPKGIESYYESFDLSREAYSAESGYAVYSGSLERITEEGVRQQFYLSRICFADHPESDYYFTDDEGNYIDIWSVLILPDGSFIGYRSEDGIGIVNYRYDPFTREFLPFYDGREYPAAGDREGVLSPYAMVPDEDGTSMGKFLAFEGSDLIFGRESQTDTSLPGEYWAFSPQPFAPMRKFATLKSLERIEGTDLLMGRDGKAILIYSLSSLEQLMKIEDAYTASGPADLESIYPDGRKYLALSGTGMGLALYDLNTGRQLCEITGEGVSHFVTAEGNLFTSYSFTSEGHFIAVRNNTPFIIDPLTGKNLRQLPDAGDTPSAHGPYDPSSCLRSESAVCCGGIVYEYREEPVPIPESLADKIILANRLLQSRSLTELERKTYQLD